MEKGVPRPMFGHFEQNAQIWVLATTIFQKWSVNGMSFGVISVIVTQMSLFMKIIISL